jgi:aminoglycoside 6-adenylyltransferase
MHTVHAPEDVLRRLVQWAERREAVRALLLTSSRANPAAHVDMFSDYDVLLVVTDIHPFFTDRSWLYDFGEVLVAYWDPIACDPEYGIERTGNVIHYADGLHLDFKVWPVRLMQRIAQAAVLPGGLDDGYAVLLDKDRVCAGMRPPTYRAYIPTRPTEDAYLLWIEEFFSDVPYVAKCLWRDELLPARQCLDCDMKQNYLVRMLEWRVERDYDWSLPTGWLGKGLKKRLSPVIWSQLERTYVGAGIDDTWEALFATIALFRQVGCEVADDLGYTYPHDVDERVTAYAQEVRSMQSG